MSKLEELDKVMIDASTASRSVANIIDYSAASSAARSAAKQEICEMIKESI